MNEGKIRDAIVARVASTAAGSDAAYISEMFVDGFARRADLVIANGRLSVFEIKSQRDSLERLDGQLESYCRFFEQVTVVCAPKHVPGVQASAQCCVGIWSISDSGVLKVVRAPRQLSQRSIASWVSFLPVDELRVLLRTYSCSTSGYREDLVRTAEALSLKCVRSYVLEYLKRRELRIALRLQRSAVKRELLADSVSSAEEHLQQFLKTIDSSTSVAIPRRIGHSSKKSSPSAPSLLS